MNENARKTAEDKNAYEEWLGKHYAFFANKECECFPCHEKADKENFSCLFCYCPLYALKDECGGNFFYNEKGYKDCSNCLVPHKRENYGFMIEKCKMLCDRINRENRR